MVRNVAVSLTALFLLGLSTVDARGQGDLLAEIYGEGVHLYFGGQYAESHEMLTAAIDQGIHDPRCYYFRGVVLLKLGRPDESASDFQTGAQMEASGDAPIGTIGRSLSRIQGPVRMQIESQRRKARLAVQLRAVQRNRQRYEQFQNDETRVLRGSDPPVENLPVQPAQPKADAQPPLPADTQPPNPAPTTPAPADDDPFADPKPKATPAPPKATPAPAKPAPTDDDPFADPTPKPAPAPPKPVPPKPAPTEDDPFADPKPKPAPTPPKPAPDDDDDPFK